MAFFAEVGNGDLEERVRRLRPAPLPPTARAAVLASLPREGELAPNVAEEAKIAALGPVFAANDRDGLVVVKVIDVGHAFVGLHARTVLLLSRDALAILDANELQALAAHELAHELFWDEYQTARARGDHDVTRELELRCDGIAVATLARMGGQPEPLLTAIDKMTRYNEALGATLSAPNYVSLKDRRRFIRDVAAVLAARGGATMVHHRP
jgi:hypothetical protein